MSSNPAPKFQGQSRRPPGRTGVPKATDQTKFDLWLIERKQRESPVMFLFQYDPIYDSADGSTVLLTAVVIEVDRYNVRLKFTSAENNPIRWVAKINIISAG